MNSPDTLAEKLIFPGDPGWDEARRPWNLAVDQRPAAVALPESVEDVIAVVELAGQKGLRVAVQCTGHNAAPLGSLEGTILLKASRMGRVQYSLCPWTRSMRRFQRRVGSASRSVSVTYAMS